MLAFAKTKGTKYLITLHNHHKEKSFCENNASVENDNGDDGSRMHY
jgi:hypothetical protein